MDPLFHHWPCFLHYRSSGHSITGIVKLTLIRREEDWGSRISLIVIRKFLIRHSLQFISIASKRTRPV
jgi:hypothetical protein